MTKKKEKEKKKKLRNKTNKILIIIAAILLGCLILGIGGILFMNYSKQKTYNEKISLGDKYLEKMDYENAILAYSDAINIYPKKSQGYISLSEVYVKNGDYENAKVVLSSAPVSSMKEEEKVKIEGKTESVQKAEEEAKKKAEEERKKAEEAKKKAEAEAKKKAEEEAKRKAEEEAKRKAEEEARKKAEEERLAAEAAAKAEVERLAAEEAQREAERLAAEEAQKTPEWNNDLIENVRQQILDHYTEIWNPRGTYVCFQNGDMDYDDKRLYVLRYSMSEEDREEKGELGAMLSVNSLVTGIFVDKVTGEAYDTDDYAEHWFVEL